MRQVGARIEVGDGDLGTVFIIHFEGDPAKRPQVHRYDVRMGNHTITRKDTLEGALVVANALAGIEEEKSEPEAPRAKARAAASPR